MSDNSHPRALEGPAAIASENGKMRFDRTSGEYWEYVGALAATWASYSRPQKSYFSTQLPEMATDVSDRLYAVSRTDRLTGLPNEMGRAEICEKMEREKLHGLVVFCDLKGFKKINDTFGHEYGDGIIQETGARLRKVAPIVVRRSGDEFLAFLPGYGLDELARTRDGLQERLGDIEGDIGVAFFEPRKGGNGPGRFHSMEEALSAAEQAMYDRKEIGKSGWLSSDELRMGDYLAEVENLAEIFRATRHESVTLVKLSKPEIVGRGTPSIDFDSQIVLDYSSKLIKSTPDQHGYMDAVISFEDCVVLIMHTNEEVALHRAQKIQHSLEEAGTNLSRSMRTNMSLITSDEIKRGAVESFEIVGKGTFGDDVRDYSMEREIVAKFLFNSEDA